ncbi:MAG TPA: type II secretion system protein GspM [Sedimentisphaerales bacterium]|nr:type II secretion system protein GspM [Sedimentisphaerales bacterium]
MIRLTRREKLSAVALAILVGGLVLFTFVVKPAIERTKTLRRVISEKQDELQKLRSRSNEYIFLRDSLDNLRTKAASQGEGFELLPFLESLIREHGLATRVATMKQQVLQIGPSHSETVVEVRLENLALRQLVDFLREVESSEVLARIKSLYIKKNLTNTDLLDSVVEIHNPQLIQS